jgi:hypothetical protein
VYHWINNRLSRVIQGQHALDGRHELRLHSCKVERSDTITADLANSQEGNEVETEGFRDLSVRERHGQPGRDDRGVPHGQRDRGAGLHDVDTMEHATRGRRTLTTVGDSSVGSPRCVERSSDVDILGAVVVNLAEGVVGGRFVHVVTGKAPVAVWLFDKTALPFNGFARVTETLV